jgi:predicted O-linked N-acetylglucosamine transferase (SPINDLY family)
MPEITLQQAFDLAIQHHQAGRLSDAESLYRQILAVDARHSGCLHYLGVIAQQVGRHDLAVELIRQSLSIQPNDPAAHSNLGNALKDLRLLDEAIAAYREAIVLQPDYPEAHNNLGNALRSSGQLEAAVSACRRALALRPAYPEAHNNLGNVLKDQGQLDEAIAAYRRALTLRPDYAEAHNNLGTAFGQKGQLDEAIAALRQAVALHPAFPEAYSNLGNAQRDKGRLDEAIAAYRQALVLQPNLAEAHSNLGNALKEEGQLDEAITAFRRALALRPDYPEAHSNLIFCLNYSPEHDVSGIAAEARRWNAAHAEPLRPRIKPHRNERSPQRRLRIAYISPDLREHAVARFLLPLLANHDHKAHEIFAYADVAAPDATTRQLRLFTDHWRSIVGLSDEQVADVIRRDGIDILVDLALHTAGNRLLVFARKPAPVQVTYLAYAGTSGLSTMDYRLTDPFLDPPGSNDGHYSEKSFRLPKTYWCYAPTCPEIPVGPLSALEGRGVTFGSLNNFSKINASVLDLWLKILHAVPDSRLVLHANEGSHRQRILDLLARAGIAPERLSFTGRRPIADYYRGYHEIDIALDPFPFAGGTTSCDALWMGVPLVTLSGQTPVSRAGLSLLSNLGLPELVAHTAEDYVRIAVNLAGDLPRLAELRASLRARMEASPLMGSLAFTRDIETAYRIMWRAWCAQP